MGGKGYIIASELVISKLSPEDVKIYRKKEDTSFQKMGFGPMEGHVLIRDSVSWKGRPENMPTGAIEGLLKAIEISKKCAGVKGMGTHPTKGYRIPQKDVCQIKNKLPPEQRKPRKYKPRGKMTLDQIIQLAREKGATVPTGLTGGGFITEVTRKE